MKIFLRNLILKMSNDFTLITNRIKKMIDEERYHEALVLLMEEVKNPLFSSNQQLLIKLQIKNLTDFIKQRKENLFINSLSKNQLIDLFLSKKYNLELLEELFKKHSDKLETDDYLKLQTIFLDAKLDNMLKINFLKIFKNYNIDHDFDFLNAMTKSIFKINPKNNFNIDNYDIIFKLATDLEIIFYKDIAKSNIAKQIVNRIYTYFFNDYKKIEYSSIVLFDHIIDFVEHAFDNKYPIDENFSN